MKLRQENNKYYVTSKAVFEAKSVDSSYLSKAFEFAFEMAFGRGHHRNHRSGGKIQRSEKEIFVNAFQGKLAEVLLYNCLVENGIKCNEPDFNIYGKGKWDDVDIEANGKLLCIKSAAFFSNLLLLEAKDWDNEGKYIPNCGIPYAHQAYDYFLLIRVKPDIKSIFQDWEDDKTIILSKILSFKFYYDIAGWCTINTLIYIIKNEYYLPKHSLLNGKVLMDAHNYYIQAGNLKNIDELIEKLKM